MAHHNKSVLCNRRNISLFQVSHTRKKVIYFPLEMFLYHFLASAFIFLNQYNRVHEVLCILYVFYPIRRLISTRLHMFCVQSKMIKLSIFIYFFLGSVLFYSMLCCAVRKPFSPLTFLRNDETVSSFATSSSLVGGLRRRSFCKVYKLSMYMI